MDSNDCESANDQAHLTAEKRGSIYKTGTASECFAEWVSSLLMQGTLTALLLFLEEFVFYTVN